MSDKPIGIFDSGVGGLTVCKAVNELLPGENIIYFGDTARFPYGTRSRETIINYSREITGYLRSRDVKMIIIACNTSSAAALDILQKENTVPIIGVVEAGARAACRRTLNGPIGIIATRATVNSGSYIRAIHAINESIPVHQQQATLFVTLAEEGLTDHPIARLAAREYLDNMYRQGVRTVILGCTHFPLLKKAIVDEFPEISLVDTGEEIALEVEQILRKKNLENPGAGEHKGTVELYASDITDTMQQLKNVFFRCNGNAIQKLTITG